MASLPQYIFGYGSLVESQSRARTWASALYASPVIVKGIRRGWFDNTGSPGFAPTYLGAVPDAGHICNGVVFSITADGLVAYDKRESGYKREKIPQANITMLDGSGAPPEGEIWFYASTNERPASPQFPIVQSYVDICLNGCMQIEATYPLAKAKKYADMFIKTSLGWSEYWVNDRIYPRRPFIYEPNAYTIDQLLQDALGKELFSKIQIEPASWEQ
jgi:hypothetical protein